MNADMKKILLTGTALVAVSFMGAGMANAQVELNPATPITSSVPLGLVESNAAAAETNTIDSNTGAITLGANGTPSVNINVAQPITLNVTTSGFLNSVVFADKVNTIAGATLTINATNDHLKFLDNVSEGTTINVGSAVAGAALTVTVDTANPEDIIFSGAINAVDATDTVKLNILNSAGGARKITFTNLIGGGSDATRIDAIQIGDSSASNLDVTFENNVNVEGNITLGASGPNTTNTVTFGKAGETRGYTGTVVGAIAGDTNNVVIVGGSTTSFNSAFGENLDNITIGGTGTTATTFRNNIAAVTGAITLAGTTNAVTNNITFDATGRGGAALTVGSAITGAHADAINNIVISGGTDQIVELSGGATNIDTFTINSGTTLKYGGAAINNVSGSGGILTLDRAGDQAVTADVGTMAAPLAALNLIGSGTKTLNNAVFATVMNIGAVTADAKASINGNVHFTDNGTLKFAHNAGTTGSIMAGTASHGTVNFAGATAVDGAIGTANEKIGTLSVDSADNTHNVGFNGAVNADTLAFTGVGSATLSATSGDSNITTLSKTNAGTAILNLAGTSLTVNGITTTTGALDLNFVSDNVLNLGSGVSFKGNVTNGTTGHGTINYSGGLTIDGNLAQLRNLTVTSPLDVKGNATAANSMDVGINAMTVGGTFATTADTILTYRVNTPTTSGKITSTGEATVVAGTKVNMIVDTNVYVAQGQEFLLIDGAESGGNVATLADGNLTTTNTALLHFKQKVTDKNNLVVYADRTQMNVAATIPNNAAVGAMLDQLGAGGNADITDLQVRLGKLNTAEEVEQMLSTVTPDISGGTVAASAAVGNNSSAIVNNRVNATRNGQEFGTGVASGDWAQGGHFWGQAFGATADQGMRNRIAGYEADSHGVVFGVDAEMTDKFRAGLAFTYARTDVDSKDSNSSDSDIDSYQISLYGDYDLGNSYFVSGQLAYMYSDIDTVRYNVGGIAGNTARADFSSDQYTIRAEAGRQFALDNSFTLTPSLIANYNYIDVEDYTERGAGGLSLRNVDTDEVQILEFGANVIAEGRFDDTAGGSIRPNIHAGYRYDVIGDNVATIGSLAGGGAAFKTEGFEPARHTTNVGAGITWESSANIDFTLNYDYEHKSDYDAHSGFIRAGYKF